MRRLFLFVTAAIFLLIALPAAAADDPCGAFRDENCNPIAENPESTNGGGGNYAYCVARSAYNQECQDIVTFTTDPGTLCAEGCKLCGGVKHSASCNCDPRDKTLTGTCTYW
jgi:hypothetical protein